MDAREIHDGLVPEIKEMLAFVAVGYPVRELGDQLEKLSEYFQALGIAYLLEYADQDRFRENLVRSGHARRYFLRKSREENNPEDRRLALGRTEALLDVLAAGHLGLAREIVDLSIETWHPDWEYEDDFSYYLFLHRLVQANPDATDANLREILATFERALEDGESPRLDVCQALLDRDTASLREALTRLMQERDKEMEKAPGEKSGTRSNRMRLLELLQLRFHRRPGAVARCRACWHGSSRTRRRAAIVPCAGDAPGWGSGLSGHAHKYRAGTGERAVNVAFEREVRHGSR